MTHIAQDDASALRGRSELPMREAIEELLLIWGASTVGSVDAQSPAQARIG